MGVYYWDFYFIYLFIHYLGGGGRLGFIGIGDISMA